MTEIRTLRRVNAVSAPKLDTQLKKLQASGEGEVIVDMGETTYTSSVGLQAFVSVQKKMDKNGGSVILKSAQPCIREVFEITGFGGVLIIG